MRVKASANTGTVTRNKVRPPSELDVAVAAVVRRSCSNPRRPQGTDSSTPAFDNPSSNKWKYTRPAYGCHGATALRTPL